MNYLNVFKAILLPVAMASSASFSQSDYIIANKCLTDKMPSVIPIAVKKNYSLLHIRDHKLEKISQLAKKNNCGGFVNITHHVDTNKTLADYKSLLSQFIPLTSLSTGNDASYSIKHQPIVNQAINSIVANNIWATLTHLTSYNDRAPNSYTGMQAAYWLKNNFNQMVAQSNRKDSSSYFIKTGENYKQPSLVTVIGKDINAPAIVIGAHMDTYPENMPGADDDGSGSSILVEIARVLLNTKVDIKHPIYFIWYAAEEEGLVGSQFVVQHFIDKNIQVKAVMQIDGAGFRHNDDSTVWLINDMVDKNLTFFVEKLFRTYAKINVGYTSCGYACSDHASWTLKGFASTFPYESKDGEENPYYHTSQDIMEYISLEHMVSFTKAGIAFALELSLEVN